jgi:hypothetical protein
LPSTCRSSRCSVPFIFSIRAKQLPSLSQMPRTSHCYVHGFESITFLWSFRPVSMILVDYSSPEEQSVQSSLVINPSGIRHFDLRPVTFYDHFSL